MKRKYETVQISVVAVKAVDVIRTSSFPGEEDTFAQPHAKEPQD